jgi:amino acid permease
LPALLMTSSISALCFGSSFIGSGELWAWLQNLVGVSNQVCRVFRFCLCLLIDHGNTQIAWFSIGLASWRFRKAWKQQGRSLDDLKFRAAWTWPWGPPFVVRNSPPSSGILALTYRFRYSP